MITYLQDFINKVKNKKIKDRIVLFYFYLLIDIEYELDLCVWLLIHNYEEKYLSYKGASINKKENKLYINDSNIIIENFDNYKLNQADIKKIKSGKIQLPLNAEFFSLKGYIVQREFTSKEGNIIIEEFIRGKLVEDILEILYGKNINVLTSELAIELIQKNTFYFPINNPGYAAYTDKNSFKIYIDYSINEVSSFKEIILSDNFKHLIRKAFMIVHIQHEYGHIHKPLLVYLFSEKNLFDSPCVKLKISDDTKIKTSEGGKIIEYLLYERIIEELNMKEIIYICNLSNFSKNLEVFRRDFLNLKNENLLSVFEREAKGNPEINEIFEEYKRLPEEVKNKLEKQIFKSAKRTGEEIPNDLENIYFESSKRNKSHDKHKKDKKDSY